MKTFIIFLELVCDDHLSMRQPKTFIASNLSISLPFIKMNFRQRYPVNRMSSSPSPARSFSPRSLHRCNGASQRLSVRFHTPAKVPSLSLQISSSPGFMSPHLLRFSSTGKKVSIFTATFVLLPIHGLGDYQESSLLS